MTDQGNWCCSVFCPIHRQFSALSEMLIPANVIAGRRSAPTCKMNFYSSPTSTCGVQTWFPENYHFQAPKSISLYNVWVMIAKLSEYDFWYKNEATDRTRLWLKITRLYLERPCSHQNLVTWILRKISLYIESMGMITQKWRERKILKIEKLSWFREITSENSECNRFTHFTRTFS